MMLQTGSRAAVPRRSEWTRFSFTSDDEVGGVPSAIRSERSEQLNTEEFADKIFTAALGTMETFWVPCHR
jgi:hypothetical protein